MSATYEIGKEYLDLDTLGTVVHEGQKIALSDEAQDRVVACREFLDNKLKQGDRSFYGINTGFGSLQNVKINAEDTEALQRNLVLSHACGIGDPLPTDMVRIMMLLKIQSLSYGHSGVKLDTVQRLLDMYNEDVIPVVYEQGSLGASGDLVPLAHMSLPLLGEGKVHHEGKLIDASTILKEKGWDALHLGAKEGLALLNGTQFMSALASWCLIKGSRLQALAVKTAALSLDAFDCHLEPFEAPLHMIRPHEGQEKTATAIRYVLKGSEIANREKEQVQDPYSFRCVPQVHGASYGAMEHVKAVVLIEINSVTDNPNIFPEGDAILSGGNFHGQPLALALDYLGIALHELGNISERRTYQLLSGTRGLPPFLIADPGLHSGLMIPQYAAASLVSQNKQLCTPASIDNITSSNGQEDHVSMGANAATKCVRIVNNLENILAIEWLTAAQAIEFRRPLKTSEILESLLTDYRKTVSFNEADRILHDDIMKTVEYLRTV